MRYSEAQASPPPGASRFQPEDLLRLDRWALALLLGDGPGAIPPEDAAAALDLQRLPPDLARRVGSATPAPDAEAARRRVVAGAFWLLVYLLEPELWDGLSRVERVPIRLINELPAAGRVLEVAAGTGRLTGRLSERAGMLVAVEPAAQLRAVLRRRVPEAWIVAGLGQALPVRDGWADLVVSCAAFGPDAPWGGDLVLAELERCALPGGTVALVGPEEPAWFEARGYRRQEFEPDRCEIAPELAAFFGPQLSPPRELLLKRG